MQIDRRLILIAVAAILLFTVLPTGVFQGQSGSITLSLVMPDYRKDVFSDMLIADFESANPGVKIRLVTNANISVPPAAEDVNKHLEALGKFASAGDVLLVSSREVSPSAVNAGYYLNLAPLVDGDKDLNPDDFQPAVWQSFQWDKGIWALPLTANLWFISYDPASFDKAGLSYPSDTWTLDEFANDIRKLTIKDASGKVTTPGLIGLFPGYNDGMLIRSGSGEPLYDGSALPSVPALDKPAIASFLKTWTDLQAEGLLEETKGRGGQIPLLISTQDSVRYQPQPASESDASGRRIGVMFPGGRAGLDVQGIAISAGTQHPEQAYALARFLTTRAEVTSHGIGLPARKSLLDAQSLLPTMTPEDRAFLDKAFAAAMPPSDLRYVDYFENAAQQVKTDHVNPQVAIQAQQNKAFTDQQTAIAMKASTKLVVAVPAPTPILRSGEVSLKFGLGDFASPLPTQDQWDRLIQEFTSTDPQVRQLVMESDFNFNDLKTNAPKYDCFFAPFNVLTSQNISALLSLDPFIAADQSLSKDDLLGTMLSQVTIDNKTWGLPVVITPTILKYNTALFRQAGVPEPDSTWTVDKFKDTLTALKTDSKAEPPFALTRGTTDTALLILIAAYGGVPLDYRTNPPTINYTDPAAVTAIRQVLDLARQGYLGYPDPDKLKDSSYNPLATPHAIYDTTLDDFTIPSDTDAGQGVYKPVGYPHGTQFSAISYSVGFAAISATSQNPDACYRWINTIARHPELFQQMPARHSVINDTSFRASQKKEVVDMYDAIAAALKNPNTLVFPDSMGATALTGYVLQHWLFEAFDSYVLHDKDLDSALKDAEAYSKGFQVCAQNLPPYDPSPDVSQEYYKAVAACAINVDPRMSSFFESKG